jgi:hypothetical protein
MLSKTSENSCQAYMALVVGRLLTTADQDPLHANHSLGVAKSQRRRETGESSSVSDTVL